MIRLRHIYGVLCLGLLFSASALGAVSLAGTRLIFDGKFREVSIEASNRGDKEVLLQAWLSDDPGQVATPDNLPFVVTPHLVYLRAQGKQSLRLLYEGVGMPTDRESLLYLYVMEIPRRSEAQQQLTIAVRQRINVFYRPAGLRGDPADAAQTLSWQLAEGLRGEFYLRVRNPTLFHVSLLALQLDGLQVSDHLLIKPGEAISVPLARSLRAARLSFKALTDYGGQRSYCVELNGDQPPAAQLTTHNAHPLKGKC
ncbi:MAG TPA: molecular chaperone [Pseudomonas sp.]|uniref:fimbrial biogenesis chaperone n=1 Tax=Pseudomonas sp. TaxID=306 RepID=UPI002EDA4EE3